MKFLGTKHLINLKVLQCDDLLTYGKMNYLKMKTVE